MHAVIRIICASDRGESGIQEGVRKLCEDRTPALEVPSCSSCECEAAEGGNGDAV